MADYLSNYLANKVTNLLF